MKISADDIENILFDLGGVLLDIDYSVTEKAFQYLGLENFNEVYSQHRQEGLFDDFEKGLIKKDDFILRVKDYFKNEIPSREAIEQAWNAMLIDFPVYRLEMLTMLRKHYNLYVVSNTNEIHFEAFNRIFKKNFNKDFTDFFKSVYYSHELGMRKPEPRIFQHIIAESMLDPEKTLYIDDSNQHIKAAKKLKFKTLPLKNGQEVVVLLHDLMILA